MTPATAKGWVLRPEAKVFYFDSAHGARRRPFAEALPANYRGGR